MKALMWIILITVALQAIQDTVLISQIDEIRQDIVEIKKGFSYDPKDAK